jgi:guanylate kinase
VAGVDYNFMSAKEFSALRAAGGFLEANEVHGNWYGTPRSQVNEGLTAGRHVILKIDVQGAQVVKGKVPGALLIFLVPPSMEDLFQRLRSRATETADELEVRQRNAAIELARQEDYDYVVTNETGQVERVAERIDEIIAAERQPPRSSGRGSPAVALTRGDMTEAWPDSRVRRRRRPRARPGRWRSRWTRLYRGGDRTPPSCRNAGRPRVGERSSSSPATGRRFIVGERVGSVGVVSPVVDRVARMVRCSRL